MRALLSHFLAVSSWTRCLTSLYSDFSTYRMGMNNSCLIGLFSGLNKRWYVVLPVWGLTWSWCVIDVPVNPPKSMSVSLSPSRCMSVWALACGYPCF